MRIIKDSILYLGGELFAKALPFLLLPYLTRRLGIDAFGEMSYYSVFLSFFVIIVGLSQDGAVARYYYVYGKRNLSTVVFSGYLYTFAITILGSLIALFFNSLIFLILICTAAGHSILATQLSLRQCQKQALSYITIQLASGILSSLLTIIILELANTNLVLYRFISILFSSALVSLIAYLSFLYLNKKNKYKISFKRKQFFLSLQYIFSFGLPLVFHHISSILKTQSDKLLIYNQYSSRELGIYAAAYQIAAIFTVLLMAINKATLPYYFEGIKNKQISKNTIFKWSFYGIALSPIPAIIAYLIPESLFITLLGKEYIGTSYYICVFLLAIGFTIPYFILVNYLFYFGKNHLISISSFLNLSIYILILYLMSQISIKALPFAILATNLINLPILYFFIKNKL